jgi:hypothetical protein
MKTYDEMEFHPTSEKLVEVLCQKTGNTNPQFFRMITAYYNAQVASMMRASVQTIDNELIPVNLYAINLATTGAGKGKSTSFIENNVIDQFSHNFREVTFEALAQQAIIKLANTRALKKQMEPEKMLPIVQKEFDDIGPFLTSFDSGTTPAVKQARQKLLIAEAGSLNMQIDEIASNLLGNGEVLTTFLELFDLGRVKQKLIKNTSENSRLEEIIGPTPANLLLFGSPARLLNGSKLEEEFQLMLEEGYARRCFFGYAKTHERKMGLTPQMVLDERLNQGTNAFISQLSDHYGSLANMVHVNKKIQIDQNVTLLFIEYQLKCEEAADKLGEHAEAEKAELSHRHFKALKLAGAYAFVDGIPEITMDLAYNAIKLAEHSGEAFKSILSRDKAYIKLAKYLASIGRQVTQPDLVEDLPFYKGTTSQKQEMLQLATAYGYQNNILIKKMFLDGIEFIRGETLTELDLKAIRVSYSDDLAIGYRPETCEWEDLHKLTQAQGMHWCNHHFSQNHRQEDNALPGFNIIVLDIDHGIPMAQAQLLLKDYKALFYTTKRHTVDEERYRIILPTNYELELDAKDYKEFMNNLFQWLPFDVDTATNQRARKWLSHNGTHVYQDGQILDILPFIPKTSKNETFKERVLDQKGMDNLERWVINNTGDGNRNNMLLRFAMMLVDSGMGFNGILGKVTDLNDKLPDKLLEAEILGTVMTTVTKALNSN